MHCEFPLSRLFANLKTLDPGQIMTEFEELKPFYYKEKLKARLPVFDPFIFFAFCCSYRLCRKLEAFVQSEVTDFFKWVGLNLRTVTSLSYKGNFIESVLLLLKCVLFLVYSKVATLLSLLKFSSTV